MGLMGFRGLGFRGLRISGSKKVSRLWLSKGLGPISGSGFFCILRDVAEFIRTMMLCTYSFGFGVVETPRDCQDLLHNMRAVLYYKGALLFWKGTLL